MKHNGARAKAARILRIGDKLEISRGEDRIDFVVTALSARRLSAPLAAQLYSESEASLERAQLVQDAKRLQRLARTDFGGRPDKRSRRLLRRLSGKADST